MSEHTSLKLRVGSTDKNTVWFGEKFFVINDEVMAEKIVESYNSHAKLIAENKRLREAVDKGIAIAGQFEDIYGSETSNSMTKQFYDDLEYMRQALNESE